MRTTDIGTSIALGTTKSSSDHTRVVTFAEERTAIRWLAALQARQELLRLQRYMPESGAPCRTPE